MSPRLAFAIEAVRAAGDATLDYFQKSTPVEIKADDSPITAADRLAEKMIRRAIAESYPQDGILGEEEGQTGQTENRWVIDPIDGTKSFVAGVPLYATLLAYEVGGEPELGVCYLPALGEMIYAEWGEGAFWNGQPCRVSDKKSLEGGILSCGSPTSMRKVGRLDAFLALSEQTLASRTWTDAFGHALVATGRIEAMIDPVVNRWDISALAIIVREAGGQFTDFQGNQGLAKEAISSNGHVHQEILKAYQS